MSHFACSLAAIGGVKARVASIHRFISYICRSVFYFCNSMWHLYNFVVVLKFVHTLKLFLRRQTTKTLIKVTTTSFWVGENKHVQCKWIGPGILSGGLPPWRHFTKIFGNLLCVATKITTTSGVETLNRTLNAEMLDSYFSRKPE